jgi:ferritin-like metal-binding protein YciE
MRLLVVCTTAVALAACQSPQPTTEQVLVAPLSSDGRPQESTMTREELEDHVRRFADRYFTRVTLTANEFRDQTESVELRSLMHRWKTVSQTSIVDIAIGANAVTNLLDMMVITRLSRLVVESYWIPEEFGEELGAPFRDTYASLEQDIWSVADDVLTQTQQAELRQLIDDWHAENPDQVYPWYVRLSDFSGQRAASLAAVQQSGGLLSEVARAREAAEEIQAFGERVLFYLQRAPMITSNEFTAGAGNVLQQPQIEAMVANTDRFISSVEKFVDLIDELPDERLAAIDQAMDRIGEERNALLEDFSQTEPEIRAVLTEARPIIESIENIVALTKQPLAPGKRPFDITLYTELVGEAAITAGELSLLLEALREVAADEQGLKALVGELVAAEQIIVRQAFWYILALIAAFFIMLLVYRIVANRLIRP